MSDYLTHQDAERRLHDALQCIQNAQDRLHETLYKLKKKVDMQLKRLDGDGATVRHWYYDPATNQDEEANNVFKQYVDDRREMPIDVATIVQSTIN